MISRVRVHSRIALLATCLAVLASGAAGYGIFGAVPMTSAILETTSQVPAEIAPRPSPGVVPSGPASTLRPYNATPLIAVLALGGGVAIVLLIRRRTARA